MAHIIKVKKGLDINLKGKPKGELRSAIWPALCTIYPDDYPGFVPKLAIKAEDRVLAGEPILYDKNRPDIKVVSPVSGKIAAINRGEKRKLLSIVIEADKEIQYKQFGKKQVSGMSGQTIKLALAEAGILPFIRRRPYDYIADPADMPRDIFVPGFYSTPLAPNLDLILRGQEADFQTGLDALAAMTDGKVYLGISNNTQAPCLINAKNVSLVTFKGPHPAGNSGVQINHIKPMNKGETVWTVDPANVLYIGRFFNKGIVDLTRIIALTGSEVKEAERVYYPLLPGTPIGPLMKSKVPEDIHLRYISGNVLTGTHITLADSLHACDNQITVIPEGDETHEFVGWAMPGLKKFSVSKSYPAFLIEPVTHKEYQLDARIKGGRRAMIMSNEWDKVFPMDIMPEFLVRAIIAMDIDKMENLGIYEVAPEDFALCEFVDTSKMELQKIVRQGLDWLYKEMS